MGRTQGILLIGPTGSGKTPLGAFIESRGLWGRRCCHLDFGAQLRRAAAGDSAPDDLSDDEIAFLKDVLRSGALLEDERFSLAEKILRAFIRERHVAGDDLIILNGLPRHTGQAQDVAATVEVLTVIRLVCTPEVAHLRIQTNAGGDRANRDDDGMDAVRAKLTLFAERTGPLVDYYRRRGVPVTTIEVRVGTIPEDIWRGLDVTP